MSRRFVGALIALTVLGVGIRVALVTAVHEPSKPGFLVDYDPIFYHRQANLVADGRGFIAPYVLDDAGHGPVRPSAGHPPLLVVVLAGATKLGLRSFRDHRLVVALLGAAVVPLLGLLGLRLRGPRCGLIAAFLGAVFPPLWLYDGMLMPEALAGTLVVGALLTAYWLYDRGRVVAALLLGALIALATLTRGELALLLPILAVPVALMVRGASWRRRFVLVGASVLATFVVLAPWVAYNLHRFEKPVYVSTAVDTTLGGAYCRPTFHGVNIGGWTDRCFNDILARGEEESVSAAQIRSRAVHFAKHNVARLPIVVVAREGRVFELFHPRANVLVGGLERRPQVWSWIGIAFFFALVPFAIAGVVLLRRRRVPLTPLLAMVVLVVVTVAVFYGNDRFRRPFDLVLIALAAVAIDALLPHSRRQVLSNPPEGLAESSEPGEGPGHKVQA